MGVRNISEDILPVRDRGRKIVEISMQYRTQFQTESGTAVCSSFLPTEASGKCDYPVHLKNPEIFQTAEVYQMIPLLMRKVNIQPIRRQESVALVLDRHRASRQINPELQLPHRSAVLSPFPGGKATKLRRVRWRWKFFIRR
jgi:hypothetical protein